MKRDAGFTLIEVVIAITVIVVAMVALATMSLTALRSVDRNGERTIAVAMAQSRIEVSRGVSFGSLEDGTTVVRAGGALAGYETATVVESTASVGLKQVTVTVTTPSGQQVRLTSLIGI